MAAAAGGTFDDPVEEAKEVAEEIITLCDEDDEQIPSDSKDRKPEYFESCAARAKDILETVKRIGHVTDRQLDALRNTRDGLLKWVRGG